MKKFAVIISLGLIFNLSLLAGPGDTTLVQTLKFSDITKRRGWYVFPADTIKWHKILMYYTLKCDPATTQDQYPCGEWDYTTYTNLYSYDNVGAIQYSINGSTPDTILFRNNETFNIIQNYQYYIIHDSIISEQTFSYGSSSIIMDHVLKSSIKNGRSQYLWRASELSSSGLTAGDITGIILNINLLAPELKHFKIKLKNTVLNELSLASYESNGFTTVYNKNTAFTNTGNVRIDFTQPFYWDGTSNIIIEFSFSNTDISNDFLVEGDSTVFICGLYNSTDDGYLSFKKPEYVKVPSNVFANIDSFITVSFWQYGDTNIQPSNTYLFEGRDSANNRVINVHLPWSNGNVYWDAGNSGSSSYDRIYKAATPQDYKGQWNHWAFTKNVATGEMKIYLNGSLWYSETGKNRRMYGIKDFRICAPAYDYGRYDGFINDFRIWDIELDSNLIKDWMYKDVDINHPYYSHLKAYYKFDEQSGYTAYDSSPSLFNAQLMGIPGRNNISGENTYRNLIETNQRPAIEFIKGVYNSHLDSIVINDTLIDNMISVEIKKPYIDTNVTGISYHLIDTVWGWQATTGYVYNPSGDIIDSINFYADTLFINEFKSNLYQLQNFVTPYGINLDLGPNGFTWMYDVSDYAPLFHDTVEISAGNQQELIDLKFIMIEGTPPRNVNNVKTIWTGDYGHANIADDIELPAVNVELDTNSEMFMIRTRTTGHGMGSVENCGEFCPKHHFLKINGVQEFQWLNWTECATNPLYPQGGTWIFDRAGWCPGRFADTYDWEITDLVNPGDIISIDYGMEAYPSGGGQGNYRIAVQLFEYDSANFNNDAAITEIVSPNSNSYYNRENPICGSPVIEIQNTGINDLLSLQIDYGYEGSLDYQYVWTGNLKFLEKEKVVLPPVDWDYFTNDSVRFQVTVSNPNGGNDEYPYNNTMFSEIIVPPVYYTDGIIIVFRTNAVPAENYYQLKDADGNIVYEKYFTQANTTHIDTVMLSPGCYDLTLEDTDEDGISFWYFPNDGSGWLRINDVNGGALVTSIERDFGKNISLKFAIAGNNAVNNIDNLPDAKVFPNPVDENLNIKINNDKYDNYFLYISDIYGKIMMKTKLSGNQNVNDIIDMSYLPNGVYFVSIKSNSLNKTFKIVKQ